MREAHEGILGGHYALKLTLQKIKKRHERPILTKEVEQCIKHCDTCQRNKNIHMLSYQYTTPDIPNKPNEKLSFVLMGPYGTTEKEALIHASCSVSDIHSRSNTRYLCYREKQCDKRSVILLTSEPASRTGKSSNLLIRKKRLIDRIRHENIPIHISDAPYAVNVRKNGANHCGGSILSPYIILTAAHCLIDDKAYYAVFSGSSRLLYATHHAVIRYLMHPKYTRSSFKNDLVMLTILPPIDLVNSSSGIIQLHNGIIAPHSLATLSGWGCTHEPGMPCAGSIELRSIEVPLISKAECRKAYPRPRGWITNKEICTLDKSGNKGSGLGDSGDPLVVNGQLLGVMAWSRGLADGKSPDVYINLSHPLYRNWILAYLRHLQFHTST
ncbi:trypsin-like [Belonocnema kinseyi]|uniref:trypsin-like n=1 Tax=Belonocnema kinseyi TaxID=2817044 RepID=UPI00143D8199|nr:trypsin-like [Belonocnema kinseyi]